MNKNKKGAVVPSSTVECAYIELGYGSTNLASEYSLKYQRPHTAKARNDRNNRKQQHR
ncbi:hypothetical protein I4U23_005066 [Adineta vaga]|nr:hypothetical protein I4U23_005066 [Adineta vaga]